MNRYQVTIHIKTDKGVSHTLKPIVEAKNEVDARRMVKATYSNITFMGIVKKLN